MFTLSMYLFMLWYLYTGKHGVRGSNDGVVTYGIRSSQYSSYLAILMNAYDTKYLRVYNSTVDTLHLVK